MSFEILKEDKTVKAWFTLANLKETTKTAYLLGLQDYIDFTGKSPSIILQEAEEDADKPLRKRSLKLQLSSFRQWLQDSGKASHTVKGRVTAMKSFFQSFDIEVPKLRGEGKAHTLPENNAIPTKEDIQAVLKVCDPLEKALILVGATSGLAAAEICNLKVSDFIKGKDTKTGITTLKLRREKVGFDFVTFLTPEATQAVQDYLDYRERTYDTNAVKALNQREKRRVHSDRDSLFIVRSVPALYLKNHDDNLRKFDTATLTKLYRRLSEQAGKSTPLGNWNLIRSHNLRKFYNSAMLNAGADSFFVEFTMGHTLDDTRSAYFHAAPMKLREIYQKYVPYLTIYKEDDITESPDFMRMTEEITRLKAENEKLRLDRHENEAIKKLKEDLQDLKKAEQERETIRQEFAPVFNTIGAALVEVEKKGNDGLGALRQAGEDLEEHRKSLWSDRNYRDRWEKAQSQEVEKRRRELGQVALKTLSDNL
jgi:integrase